MKKNIKSKAKALGLKSTLVFNDQVVLTSFAKGQDKKNNNIEKVTNFKGELIKETPILFNAKVDEAKIELKRIMNVENGPKTAMVDNPLNSNIGEDYIKIKPQLEEIFFNKQYENDNARIQIAYNILDIKKILAPYINNIIYMFYNLGRRQTNSNEETTDLIGTLYFNNNYELQEQYSVNNKKEIEKREKIDKLLTSINCYYSYFGGAFKKLDKKDNKDEKKKKEVKEYNYNVLRLLSMSRQITEHHSIKVKDASGLKISKNEIITDALLFNLDELLKNNQDLLLILDKTYSDEIDKLNNSFLENSTVNIYILSEIYKNQDVLDIAKEYYNFSVIKDQKNIGINIKKVRELIIDNNLFVLKDHKYDTYRSKLYMLIDFIISKFLKTSSVKEEMIMSLRSVLTEEEKESVYGKYSNIIWKNGELKTNIEKGLKLTTDTINKLSTGELSKARIKLDVNSYEFKKTVISVEEKENRFVKLIYFLTQFLDGKEINELLCTLINKFENIADLTKLVKANNDKVVYSPEFKVFESSTRLARSLKVVKNFARMKIDKVNISMDTLVDAINMLNITKPIKKFNENGKKSNEYVNITEFLQKKDKKVRNFLINNVISSKWFSYVARYNDPEKCPLLFRNKSIISLALKEIPRSQLDRYYQNINGCTSEQLSDTEIRDSLLNKLYCFSIGDILKREILEKKKALIQFYLTIAYLITKNMVKINARFSVAFSCLERDSSLHNVDKNNRLALTKKFLEEDELIYNEQNRVRIEIRDSNLPKEMMKSLYKENNLKLKKAHYKKHDFDYVKVNLYEAEELGKEVLSTFRNQVLHLNIVDSLESIIDETIKVNKYYDLYCLVLQKYLIMKFPKELKEFSEEISKTNSYNKKLMWIINSMFGYNLSRYKKLSNEDLFYDIYEEGNK